MSEAVTRRLVARGRVQGVWFRESMRREAERLEVRGWVRNRPDGSVEAVVQGRLASVEAIVHWARRGPEAAEVVGLEVFIESHEACDGFEKRPDG